MERKTIPNTDISVSQMGLGTAMIGVKWGKSPAEADEMLGTFLEYGGNLIDTAHVYSDWQEVDGVKEIARSERLVGDWLQRSGKRNDIILITKGGHPVFTDMNCDLHKNRCTREEMCADLDGSLSKLRTDHIDIYMYHRDDPAIPVEEMVETMQDFVRQGKIRYWAVSNWKADRIRAADAYCKKMGYRGPAADEALMNLGSKYMAPMPDDTLVYVQRDSGLYDYHLENPDNLLMPYAGIAEGFFQKYIEKGPEAVKGSPYAVKENIEFAGRIPELMKKYDCSAMNIVLGFFAQEKVDCVPLYGPRNSRSIIDAVKSFDFAFDSEDFAF